MRGWYEGHIIQMFIGRIEWAQRKQYMSFVSLAEHQPCIILTPAYARGSFLWLLIKMNIYCRNGQVKLL